MNLLGRLSLSLGSLLRRSLLVLTGVIVAQAAQANITGVTITQSPPNNVAPGQGIVYKLQISSDARSDTADYPIISITENNTDVSTQFSSNECSLDGNLLYCSGVNSTSSPQSDNIAWVQGPTVPGTYRLSVEVNCTSATGAPCTGVTQAVTTVIAAPPPSAVDDSATTQADTPVKIDVLANDSDPSGSSISVVSATTPAHGSVAINSGASITYTPVSGYTGTDSFRYTIQNATGGTASAAVNLTVVAATVPVAVADSASTTPGSAVKINLLANDQLPQGQQVSVTSITTPDGGTVVNNGDGTATYTPNTGFSGTDTFNYTIADQNGQQSTASVSVTVAAVTLPTAVNDSATTQAGTAITIDVLSNDSDPSGSGISVVSVTSPAHGTAVNNSGASVTYTPAAGHTGPDRFSYTIRNANGETASATVDMTVVAATVPVAVADSAATSPGTAVKIDLLANDQAPQGQQISVASVTTPQHGTAVNNGDGTATYTSSGGFTGTDTFNYTIEDKTGQQSTATVRVRVSSTVSPQAINTNLQSLPNLTDNQHAVAVALDQLCASSADSQVQNVCGIIANLDTPNKLTAVQQITPDQLAAQGTTAVETSTTQLTNIKLRLMSLRQGADGLSMNGFSLDIKGDSLPAGALLAAMRTGGGAGASGDILGNGRLGVFINGRINFGSLDTTGRETGFDFSTNGITVGVDYRFTDQFVAGGALGYASTNSNYSGGGGKMNASDISVSTYGSYYLPRDTYIDWIATYGSTNYDTTRNMVISPSLSTQAKGSTGGNQFALSINAGKDFNRRDLLFTPYARLEYTSNSIDSYQEGGGAGLALGYNSQTIESLTTALAARLSKAMSMDWGILSPSAHVEWEHQYKDNNRLITAHFVADPGVSFSVATDNPDRNYFNVGFGVAATLPEGRSAFIDYEAVIGQAHVTNSTIDLGVRLAF